MLRNQSSWRSSLLLHILNGNSYGQNSDEFQQDEIGNWVLTGCKQAAARAF